jgi:hypothetical protein
MQSSQFLIWFVALCVPGLLPAAYLYARHCNRVRQGENRFPLALYIVVLLICAFVAFWAGNAVGVEYACRGPSAGNLCGLLGVFIVGPLSSFFTVTVISLLMTSFPIQMKRIAPIGTFLILFGIGYYPGYDFRSFYRRTVMHESHVASYKLHSGNVDDLQRYAPLVEAKMRELPALKDVSLDSQIKNEAAVLGVDPQKPTVPIVKQLPTMTITFSLAPGVSYNDAVPQIQQTVIWLGLPATIQSSLAGAK